MAQEKSFIDEVMDFDPSEAVIAFENTSSEKKGNQNIYKTNPANSTSEDGHYHSRIRVLLNPYDIKRSIVHQACYSMRDERGFFQAISSLSVGDKECPIFKGWKKLWFSKITDPNNPKNRIDDPEKKEWARQMFEKRESDWVLVQIIEDENQPELVGMFKVMKMPRAILTRMMSKMNPTDTKKQKQPLMDYLFGPVLEMDVVPGPDDTEHPERKQREISYDICDFDTDPTPIIMTDGTPLFSEEEVEMIEEYNTANNDLVKAKTQAKRDEAAKRKAELAPQIRPLYSKAIDYLKANALNLIQECGYTPWSAELTARVNAWLEKVLNMQDPTVSESTPAATTSAAPANTASAVEEAPESNPFKENDDDLPF